ncbi:MAG: pilus assembly protein [Pseudolabrys sp.]|nr:pilus assembly protein [Pseudolabrys sp.]
MMANSIAAWRNKFRQFVRDRAGNVAITFAIATLPVIGVVGAAVDFSHGNSVRAAMQNALDSTALMLARDAATLSNADLQTKALNYFTALFTRPEAKNIAISATYTSSSGSQVVVNGSATVDTGLMSAIGIRQMTINGTATSKWGNTRLRVALVLDNTGSMADYGKMTALKSATHSLLNQLQSAASTNGDVYVSIIPFTTVVNVGSSNNGQSWLDWSDYGSCSGGWTTAYDWTKAHCSADGGTRTTYSSSQKSSWKGCITDRGNLTGPDTTNNYDTNVTAINSSVAASKYPAVDYSIGGWNYCTLPQAMGLTYSWSSLSSLVDSMQPGGATNQNIGLQVGWASLTGLGPFSAPAEDSNYTYQHVMILLTDGLNTQNRWYGDGGTVGSSDDAKIDAREALTCANFKAASTTNILYTIQVNTDGDPTSTLLQNCASTSDKFYLLTSSSGIADVFTQIGTNLSKLRVAN